MSHILQTYLKDFGSALRWAVHCSKGCSDPEELAPGSIKIAFGWPHFQIILKERKLFFSVLLFKKSLHFQIRITTAKYMVHLFQGGTEKVVGPAQWMMDKKIMMINRKIILITGSAGPPLLLSDGFKPCYQAEDILQSGTSLSRTSWILSGKVWTKICVSA